MIVEKLFPQYTRWFARHFWWENSFCISCNKATCSHVWKSTRHSFVMISACRMVASDTLELLYYKGIGRQKGRAFDALAQVTERTAVPFLRKNLVPAAKRMGADLLEFAVPKVLNVMSGRKNFKSAAKSVGTQTLRKRLGGGGEQKRSIPPKSLEGNSRPRREIFN